MNKIDVRLKDQLVVTIQGDEPFTWDQKLLTAEEPGLLLPGSWLYTIVEMPGYEGDWVTAPKMQLCGVLLELEPIDTEEAENLYDLRMFNLGKWAVDIRPGELVAYILAED